MKVVALAGFGWLVPGGAYLLTGRFARFAASALLVTLTFVAGLALQGGYRWPGPAELAGLDGFTVLIFKLGALARLLAGAPYLLAQPWASGHSFLDGRVHEFGTMLLTLAGLFNLLALSEAFATRNAEKK